MNTHYALDKVHPAGPTSVSVLMYDVRVSYPYTLSCTTVHTCPIAWIEQSSVLAHSHCTNMRTVLHNNNLLIQPCWTRPPARVKTATPSHTYRVHHQKYSFILITLTLTQNGPTERSLLITCVCMAITAPRISLSSGHHAHLII